MGRPLLSLIGQKFGLLSPVEYLGRRHHSSYWLCQCDCGKTTKAHAASLKSGGVLSCGCYRRVRMTGLMLKHGERGGLLRPIITDEYRSWCRMLERVDCKIGPIHKWYGARGITVCNEWRDDFGAFLRDVGRKPTRRHTLDRIDTNGNYEPSNVRWATWNEQARNRRNNRTVSYDGRSMTLVEASEVAGIPYKTVKGRLGHGWTVDEALTVAVSQKKQDAARRGLGEAHGLIASRQKEYYR